MNDGREAPRITYGLAGMFLLGAFGCSDLMTVAGEPSRLVLHVVGAPAVVDSIRLDVAGPGISDTLHFNLPVVSGEVNDTITVPAGPNRYVRGTALDSAGGMTHRGDTILTLLPGLNPTLRLVLYPASATLPIVITFGDPPGTGWSEGFEEYATGTWPGTWIADGNGTSTASNHVDSGIAYSGARSLRLFGAINGCWAAIGYRALTVTPPFEVHVDIRNGNEALGGCNRYRAMLQLRQCCSWTNPAQRLVLFRNNGVITAGFTDDSIASFATLTWYRLRVRYARVTDSTVAMTYWLNGDSLTTKTLPAVSGESALGHLELSVLEGSAWFDNVRVLK